MPDLSQYDYKKTNKEKMKSVVDSVLKFFAGKAYPAVAVLIVAVGVSTVIATRNMTEYTRVPDSHTVEAKGEQYTSTNSFNTSDHLAALNVPSTTVTAQSINSFVIEAEDYDAGGQNTAYNDRTKFNEGDAYRSDGVDIEIAYDDSGSYNVGWIDSGEWLSYTFETTGSGSYDLNARIARSLWEGDVKADFHIEIDGTDVTGTLNANNTDGWQTWKTMNLGTIFLEAGSHKLVFRAHVNDERISLMNINWFGFVPSDIDSTEITPGPPADNGSGGSDDQSDTPITAKSFLIQAEDYGTGGQNVSYWDVIPGNEGGKYRNDDVDIEDSLDNDNGYNLGYTHGNEWLKYNFNVNTTAEYEIQIRIARYLWEGSVAANFNLEIDGQDITGTLSAPDTGGWHEWVTISGGKVDLTKGAHELVLRIHDNDNRWGLMNINWFRFDPGGTVDGNDPAPTPEPSPIPVPDPIPEPIPIPDGGSDGIAFGQRPIQNGQITISGQNNVVIENLHFKDMQYAYDGTNNHVGILITGSTNITIRNVDFENMSQPIAIFGGSNIVIEYTRTQGITGPSERHNVQTGNFVQTVNSPSYVTIRNNTIYGGDTEDIISLYSASYSLVENNYIDGTGWFSNSGTGIILGDSQGRGNVARGNTLINPGQVGIAIAGGWDHIVENNIIYGPMGVPGSNIAAYCSDYSNTVNMSGNAFRNNRAWYWSELYNTTNGFYNPCGAEDTNNNWTDGSIVTSL